MSPVISKRVTVIVRSRSEGQAAEALRGAVGLGGGGHHVQVLLCDEGVHALGMSGPVGKALRTLQLLEQPIFADAEALAARSMVAPPWALPLLRYEIARLLEHSDAVEAWR